MFEKIYKYRDNILVSSVLLIILIVIIFIVNIWKNSFGVKTTINDFEIPNYNNYMVNYYMKDVTNKLKISQINYLYENLDEDYIKKYNLTKENYKDYLLSNNFLGNDIKVQDYAVNKLDNNKYNFRYKYLNGNVEKYVNFIETIPGRYTISFEQDFNYVNNGTENTGNIYNIDYTIRVKDNSYDSVTYELSLTNRNNMAISLDLNDYSNIEAELNNGERVTLSYVIGRTGDNVLNNEMTTTREFVFNINYSQQSNVKKLILKNVEIDKEKRVLEFDIGK